GWASGGGVVAVPVFDALAPAQDVALRGQSTSEVVTDGDREHTAEPALRDPEVLGAPTVQRSGLERHARLAVAQLEIDGASDARHVKHMRRAPANRSPSAHATVLDDGAGEPARRRNLARVVDHLD